MPLRSVKMKRFILGFHRRVWCPKWTPLSRSWRVVTTAKASVLPCRHTRMSAYGCSATNPSTPPDAGAAQTRLRASEVETACAARPGGPESRHAKSDLMADLLREVY